MANVYFEKKNGENLLLNNEDTGSYVKSIEWSTSGNGWSYRFSDGLQIEYGWHNNAHNYDSFTFINEFIHHFPALAISRYGTNKTFQFGWDNSKNDVNNFNHYTIIFDDQDYTGSVSFEYIAIGQWK